MTSTSTHGRRSFWRKIILLATALLVLLVVLFFLWPTTDDTWARTKRELEARGEILDWEKVIPPEPPPGENLFDNLVAASLLPLKGNPTPPNPLGVGSPSFPANTADLGIPFALARLKEIEGGYRSLEGHARLNQLAKWFEQWDESFAQLRDAGKRPHVRLPGTYANPMEGPMLNFVSVRNLAQVLASRAKVHLLLGDSAVALQDLDTLSVVMRALDASPGTLVSAMIEVAVAGLYLEVVTDGLRERLWQERELKQLIPRLLRLNLLAAVENGFRTERTAILRHLDAIANRGRDPLYASTVRAFQTGANGFLPTAQDILVRVSPPNWVRRNQAHYAVIIQGFLDAIDADARQVDFEQVEQSNTALKNLTSEWSPYTALAQYVTPNFQRVAETIVRNQTTAQQAAVICALELFRLRNGTYPEDLSHLVPDYISSIAPDIIPGAQIVYEKTPEGWSLSRLKDNSAAQKFPGTDFSLHFENK